MTVLKDDSLLLATRFLLIAASVFVASIGVVALIAALIAWPMDEQLRHFLLRHTEKAPLGNHVVLAVSLLSAVLATHSALTFQFLRNLIAIITSVGKRSPFIADNAKRLRTMGWVVLTIQAISLLLVPATGWFRAALGSSHFFIPFSIEGLIGALLLFILARVFDHGTRLSEDIEGTI